MSWVLSCWREDKNFVYVRNLQGKKKYLHLLFGKTNKKIPNNVNLSEYKLLLMSFQNFTFKLSNKVLQ